MKAAYRTTYGKGNVLSIREVEKPVPANDQVLVRVHAATVNRTDCHILWGRPFVMRLFLGLFRPRKHTTGCDFAGEIEVKGEGVRNFNVGDRVLGFRGVFGCGSHAEYIVVNPEKAVVAMPTNLNYEQAAACIEGALYANTIVRKLNPQPGRTAMVYGSTGAIGSAAVQLLKDRGVRITAVCRREHFDLMRSLGAERCIDYTLEDFRNDKDVYDFFFDAVGKMPFIKCKQLLSTSGIYASSGGNISNLLYILIGKFVRGPKVLFYPGERVTPIMQANCELIQQERFKPLIDRIYPLEQIAEAFDYVGSGQKIGNVVLKTDE
jgi:NADPH:quinone reductase-like Zn-dependent oxidoreductase